MIGRGTFLHVSDNSGAKIVKCIGGGNRIKIGDAITVAVQKKQKAKIDSRSVHKAVVVTTKKQLKRNDGSIYSFETNTCVCINSKFIPIGNRVIGATTYELRIYKLMKILSLTQICL
ncbi:MAG: uL14 family ribosomal protein [Myxococcota bacterium]